MPDRLSIEEFAGSFTHDEVDPLIYRGTPFDKDVAAAHDKLFSALDEARSGPTDVRADGRPAHEVATEEYAAARGRQAEWAQDVAHRRLLAEASRVLDDQGLLWRGQAAIGDEGPPYETMEARDEEAAEMVYGSFAMEKWLRLPERNRLHPVTGEVRLIKEDWLTLPQARTELEVRKEVMTQGVELMERVLRGETLSKKERRQLDLAQRWWREQVAQQGQVSADREELIRRTATMRSGGPSMVRLHAITGTFGNLMKGATAGYVDPDALGMWLGEAAMELTGLGEDPGHILSLAESLGAQPEWMQFGAGIVGSGLHLTGALVGLKGVSRGVGAAIKKVDPTSAGRLSGPMTLAIYNAVSLPDDPEGRKGYWDRLGESLLPRGLQGRAVAGAEGYGFGLLAPSAGRLVHRLLAGTPPALRESVSEMIAFQIASIGIASGKHAILTGDPSIKGIEADELIGAGLLGAWMGLAKNVQDYSVRPKPGKGEGIRKGPPPEAMKATPEGRREFQKWMKEHFAEEPVFGRPLALGPKEAFLAQESKAEGLHIRSVQEYDEYHRALNRRSEVLRAQKRAGVEFRAEGELGAEDFAATPDVTTANVKRAFPKGRIAEEAWGWTVTHRGHDPIKVVRVSEIKPTEAGLKHHNMTREQYEAEKAAGTVVGISGSFGYINGHHVIRLAQGMAGQGSVWHESFHAASRLVLTARQQIALMKEFKSEEDAANHYGRWIPKLEPLQRRMKNYFVELAENLGYRELKAETVFKQIRSGRAWRQGPVQVVDGGAAPTGEPNFSIRTRRRNFNKYVEEMKAQGEYSKEKADKYFKDLESTARIVVGNLPKFDFAPTKGLSALKSNSDKAYKKSLDFTTSCIRRKAMAATISEIQLKMMRPLRAKEIREVRDLLQKQGEKVTCGPCYRETSLQVLPTIVDKALQGWWRKDRKTGAMVWEPPIRVPREMLMTWDGITKDMPRYNYDEYLRFRTAFAGSMTKVPEARAEYQGEILRRTLKEGGIPDTWIPIMNRASGMRQQSWSDLEVPHILDIMEAFAHMNARGLFSQVYTKEQMYAFIFGPTGAMINMSMIAKGSGFTRGGKLAWNVEESFPLEDMMKLREMYPNVGNVPIGVSDAHIKAVIGSKDYDFLIPFHTSGMSGEMLRQYKMESWKDYEADQVWRDRITLEPVDDIRRWVFINEFKGDLELLDRLAEQRGVWPPFRGRGGPQFEDMRSWTGYEKLITDRRVWDSQGRFIEQRVVEPVFDMKEVQRAFREYEEPNPRGNATVVDEFLRRDARRTESAQVEAYDEQFELRRGFTEDPHEREARAAKAEREAVREFGTTERIEATGYILSDGTMLDFAEGRGERYRDHREIEAVYKHPGVDQDLSNPRSHNMTLFMQETGAIRVMAYGPEVNLMLEAPPTGAQKRAIVRASSRAENVAIDWWDGKTSYHYMPRGRLREILDAGPQGESRFDEPGEWERHEVRRRKLRKDEYFASEEMTEELDRLNDIVRDDIAGHKQLIRGFNEGWDRKFHTNTVTGRMLNAWYAKPREVSPEAHRSAFQYWRRIMADIVASVPVKESLSWKDNRTIDPIRALREIFPDGKPGDVGALVQEAARTHWSVRVRDWEWDLFVKGQDRGWGYTRDYENLYELLVSKDTYGLQGSLGAPDADILLPTLKEMGRQAEARKVTGVGDRGELYEIRRPGGGYEEGELKRALGARRVVEDNPGGDWLRHEQARARERMLEGRRPGGSTTMAIDRVEVPLEKLILLPGLMQEHRNIKPGDPRVAELEASIREKGFDPNKPPFINVEYDGTARVNEGNHRIRAAIAAGLETIPVDISYFSGGERAPGLFSPERLVEAARRTPEERHEIRRQLRLDFGDYEGPEEMDLPKGAGAMARRAWEELDARPAPAPGWRGENVGRDKVLDAIELAAARQLLPGLKTNDAYARARGMVAKGKAVIRVAHAGSLNGALRGMGEAHYASFVKLAMADGTWGAIHPALKEFGQDIYGDAMMPQGGPSQAGFAELMVHLAQGTVPPKLQHVVRQYQGMLDTNPKLAKLTRNALKLYRDYRDQGAEARGLQDMAETGRQPLARRLRRYLHFKLARNWLDDKIDISRLTSEAEALLGHPLEGWDNPDLIEKALAGAASGRGADAFMHGVPDPNRALDYTARTSPGIADDVLPLVRKFGRKRGPKLFALYLWANRALERWEAKGAKVGTLTPDQAAELEAATLGADRVAADTIMRGMLRRWFGEKDDFVVRLEGDKAHVFHAGKDPGMSPADAAYLVESLRTPEFERAAEKVWQYGRALLRYRAAFGALTPEELASVMDESAMFIPLRRVMTDVNVPELVQGMKGAGGDPLKGQRGSWRRVRNPLYTLAEYTAQTFEEIHKRTVANSIYKLTKQLPELSNWMHEVDPKLAPQKFNMGRIRQQLKRAGLEGVDDLDDHELLTVWVIDRRGQPQESIFPIVTPEGERKFVWIEPNLYKAITGHGTYSPVMESVPYKVAAWLTSFFKTGTTAIRPKFAFWTNPTRDFRAGMVQGRRLPDESRFTAPIKRLGTQLGMTLSALREIMPLVPAGEWHKIARFMGLDISVVLGPDRPQTRRFVRAQYPQGAHVILNPGNILDYVREKMQAMEIVPRASEMRRFLRNVGVKDPKQANWAQALEAMRRFREVTVDFQKMGGSMRGLNPVFAFLNVRVQGPRANLRAWKRDPGGALVATMTSSTIVGLWNWYMNKDKDWWQRMPWSEKFIAHYVQVGDDIIAFPISQEVDTLAYIPIAMGLEYAHTKDPRALKEGLSQVFENWEPSTIMSALWEATGGLGMDEPSMAKGFSRLAMPHPIKPIVDVAANVRSFSGGSIDSFGEVAQKIPYEERHNEYTTGLAQGLGRLTKVFQLSPKKLDYLITNVFGRVSRDIIDLIPGLRSYAASQPSERTWGIFLRGGPGGVRDQKLNDLYKVAGETDAALRKPGLQEEEEKELLSKRLILIVAKELIKEQREKLKPGGEALGRGPRNAARAEIRRITREALDAIANPQFHIQTWTQPGKAPGGYRQQLRQRQEFAEEVRQFKEGR